MTPIQEKTRRSLIGKTETRTEPLKPEALTALREVIAEARAALPGAPHTPSGTDQTRWFARPAASMRAIPMRDTSVSFDKSGRVLVGNQTNPSGQTLTLAEAAFLQSRCVQAGAGVEFWAHLQPQIIATGSDQQFMSLSEQPYYLASVSPAMLSEIDVNAETAQAPEPLPIAIAQIQREGQRAFGFSTTLTRRTEKIKGEAQAAAEIMTALIAGIAHAVDRVILEGVLATQPAPFNFGAAAATAVEFEQLRALVGISGAGASVRQDGQLIVSPGIAAQLTPALSETVIGDFSRTMAMVGGDCYVLVRRMDVGGDCEVSMWLSLDGLVPPSGRFWMAA